MPLTAPSLARFLVPGIVAGAACFVFTRVLIEPLVGAAVEYEGAREHAEAELSGGEHGHGHELFTRFVQENLGAAVGVIAFAVAMGVLFAVAYTVLSAALRRRGFAPDPTALAMLLAGGMFVAIALMPSLKYPANPPTVGLEETVAQRISAILALTVLSVVAASVAVAAGVALARRWGAWRSAAAAVGGYVVVMVIASVLLPDFHEVPGPLAGPDGIVLDGFPAEVLADFRTYSTVHLLLMWTLIGATWAVMARVGAGPRSAAIRSDDRVGAASH